jgi:Ca2+-binding RTX toxin-like protein
MNESLNVSLTHGLLGNLSSLNDLRIMVICHSFKHTRYAEVTCKNVNNFFCNSKRKIASPIGLIRPLLVSLFLHMRTTLATLAAVTMVATLVVLPTFAASSVIIVSPSNMHGWGFVTETATGSGLMVSGPAIPPLGMGSAELTVNSAGGEFIGKAASGVKLSDITNLSYSSYQKTGQGLLEISLQFPVDDDVTDGDTAYKGRIVFEPYQSFPVQATMTGTWLTWEPMLGKWWATPSAAFFNGSCSQSTPCTWNQLIALFPNIGIHPVSGGYIFKAGGGWTGGFTGNIDKFQIGISGNDTIYDFELQGPSSSSAASSVASSVASSSVASSVASSVSSVSSSSVASSASSNSSVSSTASSVSSAGSSVSSSVASSSVSSVGMCTPVSNTGLAGYWKFDENTGSTTADSSGNGHTGTLENGPVWVSGATQVAPNVSALSYDGLDDQVRVAGSNALTFGTNTFTVSSFVRTSAGDRSILGNFNGTNRGWGLYLYNTNRVNFFAYGNAGINDTSFAASILDNQWHHLAAVFTRSGSGNALVTIGMYVDGNLIGTTGAVNVGDISSATDLLFGKYLNQPHTLGTVDDVRVYGRALTANEIMQLAGGCGGSSSSGSSSSGASSVASSMSSQSSVGSSASSASSTSVSSASSSVASSVPSVGLCNGLPPTIYVQNGMIVGGPDNGSPFFGTLRGTNGNDVIMGTNGSDRIRGRDGNDTICSKGGSDRVRGDDGNDWIDGGDSSDDIQGNDGNDTIRGGDGSDLLLGSDGNDIMCAMGGSDLANGGDGNDKIDGGSGTDLINGQSGSDQCVNGEALQQCETTTGTIPQCL